MNYFSINRMNILVFLAITCLVIIFKHNVLFSPVIILDDIQYFYHGKYKDLTNQDLLYYNLYYYFDSLYFSTYSLINNTLEHPAFIRIFYLLIFSLLGSMIYIFLYKFTKDKLASFLMVMIVFLNPTTPIIITFINGSYNILFLILFVSGVYFLYKALSILDNKNIVFFLAGCFLTLLSSFFSFNAIFMSLALLFLPWWKSNLFQENKQRSLYFIVFFVTSSILTIGISILRMLSVHPYTNMSDRLAYDILSMIKNANILILNIINNYFDPKIISQAYSFPEFSFPLVICVAIIITLLTGILVILSFKSLRNKFNYSHKLKLVIDVLPFMLVSIVLVTGPLSVSKIVHPWHYFLPSIFLILFILIVFYFFLNKKVFYVFAISLVFLSIFNLQKAMKPFETSFQEQERLLAFIKNESSNWDKNAQVIILTNKTPYMSDFNAMKALPSLSYLRLKSDRPDIKFASIVPEGILNSKVNLSIFNFSYPTYIYKFNYLTSEIKKIKYVLSMEEQNAINIYTTPELMHINSSFEELCDLKQGTDFIVWPNSQADDYKSPVEFKHESNLLNSDKLVFDGLNSVSIQVDIPKNTYFRLEFTLKSMTRMKSENYNDFNPPMPMLTPAFALYQTPPFSMRFFERNDSKGSSDFYIATNSSQMDIFFEGISDCAILVGFNKKPMTILGSKSINGTWLLGRGHKERFWKGDISNMTLKTVPEKTLAKPEN